MKAFLLDADGVVLKKGEFFSEKFAREYGVPLEEVTVFFKEEYGDCQTGTKDLKVVLPAYLKRWNWTAGVEAFLEYWFADLEINPEIEGFLERCSQQGIACYLGSNNEHYRARAIEKKLGSTMVGYYFSADCKVKKSNVAFFTLVAKNIGIPAAEIMFVDNEEKNVAAAQSAGLQASLYEAGIFARLLPEESPNELKVG